MAHIRIGHELFKAHVTCPNEVFSVEAVTVEEAGPEVPRKATRAPNSDFFFLLWLFFPSSFLFFFFGNQSVEKPILFIMNLPESMKERFLL